MSTADRCQILAGITGALGVATDRPRFFYVTIVLLWWVVIDLSTTIRAERRKGRL